MNMKKTTNKYELTLPELVSDSVLCLIWSLAKFGITSTDGIYVPTAGTQDLYEQAS